MYLARRLQDAWKVLWGRSEPQQEVLRIQAEWLEVQASFANTFAKMNTWAARVAKQEQRQAENNLEAAVQPEQRRVVGQLTPPGDRKAALRHRLAEMRGLPSPPSGPISLTSPPEEESP